MKLKNIANLCFAVAFLAAIVLFTRLGSNVIPMNVAQLIFFVSGGAGMLLNLFSIVQQRDKTRFNILFWIGSLVLFIGLTIRLLHYPYSFYVIIAGTLISGISFFYNPLAAQPEEDDELLDNF